MKRKMTREQYEHERLTTRLYTGTPAADGLPVCPDCGYGYERFNSLAYHRANDCPARSPGVAEARPMSKTRSFDSTDAGSNDTYGNGYPVLRQDSVVAKGTPATLTGEVTPYDGEFGAGFFFGVTVEGKKYDFRVKEDSGNFGRLKALGKQKDLRGKRIVIGIKEYKGRDYLAILDGAKK